MALGGDAGTLADITAQLRNTGQTEAKDGPLRILRSDQLDEKPVNIVSPRDLLLAVCESSWVIGGER